MTQTEHPLLTDMLLETEEKIHNEDYTSAAVDLRKIGEHMAETLLREASLWDEARTKKNGRKAERPQFGNAVYLLLEHNLVPRDVYNDVFQKLREYGNRAAHTAEPVKEYEIRFAFEKTKEYADIFIEKHPYAAYFGITVPDTEETCAVQPGSSGKADGIPKSVPAACEPLGYTLHSDVIAAIDGRPIPSYNIAGETYIPVKALPPYGFVLSAIPGMKCWEISRLDRPVPDEYAPHFVPQKGTKPSGTPAFPYYLSGFSTRAGTHEIPNYAINGAICIHMDDFAACFSAELVWDAETSTINMKTDR